MKQILLLTIFVLAFCLQTIGQETANCPTVKLNSPAKITPIDSAMLFSVSIAGKIDSSNLEYKWTVSSGEITDGQGTVAIAIGTPKNIQGQTITATVEIKGLPEGCQNTFSESGEVGSIPACNRPLDEYGKFLWLDEAMRIDGLINAITSYPKAKGLISFSFKNNLEFDLVLSRQRKILKFLEKRKFPSSQILMRIEKEDIYRTRIWIVPEGAELPN